jgi:hypothetical protein
MRRSLPVSADEHTFSEALATSQKGQKPTSRPTHVAPQEYSLFNNRLARPKDYADKSR